MTAGTTQPEQSEHSERQQRRTLVVAALGTVLVLIVFTTPLATLASTATDLGVGSSGQAWILSSMSCGLAVALLPAGAVGDDHGRRRMFALGAAVLGATSVLSAVAPDTAVLVAGRVGQGLGGAAVLACSLGLIGHAFPAGAPRVRATGVWGASVGAGIALGPVLAAALEPSLTWRAAYGLAALIAVVVAGLAVRLLTESTSQRAQPVDLVGMVLLGAALAAIIAGLVQGRSGWAAPAVWGLLGGGVVLGVVFSVLELRSAGPMLDLRLFAAPDFAGVTLAAFAVGAGIVAAMSFFPTLAQRGLGHGVVFSALLLLGWSATSVVTALLARRLPARVTPRLQMVVGLVVIAAGQVLLSALPDGAGTARLLPGLIVAGAASGVVNAALGRQAVASVPAGLAGTGSGTNNTARYLGGALGVTVVALLAGHPAAEDVRTGWNTAVLVTAGISVAGALAVGLCRPRRPRHPRERAAAPAAAMGQV